MKLRRIRKRIWKLQGMHFVSRLEGGKEAGGYHVIRHGWLTPVDNLLAKIQRYCPWAG
ncbi:hypothetical protein TA3x_000451 [Tundrisphaera sp. TA3]|uniref:hypothetical protein n=1 Tax=Tundrisphaera sp. TA3 TaxID=3435775 RepID=UPI003EBF81F6